ncbi:MAG: beta-galactosidase, partial [Anaerolineae bacterium]|nr:beta-galactosidase [Anaerolineae bacterium]
MLPILARQVHLDFHTSEHIPDVGARFDKRQWQEALKLGRVNWFKVFATCHQGWSFYPTQFGATHPTLKFDVLGAQIE